MKDKFINNCVNYITKYNSYNETKIEKLKYGLESIYLTFTKIIIIFGISIILGIFKEALLFSIYYNILRIPSFGLHASKSWICLLVSFLFIIGIPLLCNMVYINDIIKLFIGIICFFLFLKNSPADTEKRPIVNKKRRKIFKYISSSLVLIYILIIYFSNNNVLSNQLFFSIVLQTIMICPATYKLFKQPYNNYKNYI